MPFDIDDGFTLNGQTLSEYQKEKNLPVVAFRYRPALAAELSAWRFKVNRAATADEQFAATTKLLADHLISWDVTVKKQPALIAHETLKRLPEPVLDQIVDAVTRWAPAEQAKTEGNSLAG